MLISCLLVLVHPKQLFLHFDEERLLKKLQKNEGIFDKYRALAIIKAVSEILLVWFKSGMKETPEEMAEMMLKIFNINS